MRCNYKLYDYKLTHTVGSEFVNLDNIKKCVQSHGKMFALKFLSICLQL